MTEPATERAVSKWMRGWHGRDKRVNEWSVRFQYRPKKKEHTVATIFDTLYDVAVVGETERDVRCRPWYTLRGQNATSALHVRRKEAIRGMLRCCLSHGHLDQQSDRSLNRFRNSEHLLSPQAETLAPPIFLERKSQSYNQLKNRHTWRKG